MAILGYKFVYTPLGTPLSALTRSPALDSASRKTRAAQTSSFTCHQRTADWKRSIACGADTAKSRQKRFGRAMGRALKVASKKLEIHVP